MSLRGTKQSKIIIIKKPLINFGAFFILSKNEKIASFLAMMLYFILHSQMHHFLRFKKFI